jgi:hypothetical protein
MPLRDNFIMIQQLPAHITWADSKCKLWARQIRHDDKILYIVYYVNFEETS